MMKPIVWMVMAVLALAAAAAAQTPPPAAAVERIVVTQHAVAAQQGAKVMDWTKATGGAVEAHVAVQGRITKGAPYSADTVTESVQVLADGNRIVRRTTARVSRDSEGRTRTETLGAQGVQSVMISDPVSGESWALNPETRTASRSGVFVINTKGGATGGVAGGLVTVYAPGGVKTAVSTSHVIVGAAGTQVAQPVPLPHAGAAAGVAGSVVAYEFSAKSEGDVTREELGQQTIEGLAATGTRTTTVIAAGAIGNELPIRIVSEQWFSPDLQLLVMSKFSDPRSGETTYRLANVSRAEPDRSLFTVPPDYTVKESSIKRETR